MVKRFPMYPCPYTPHLLHDQHHSPNGPFLFFYQQWNYIDTSWPPKVHRIYYGLLIKTCIHHYKSMQNICSESPCALPVYLLPPTRHGPLLCLQVFFSKTSYSWEQTAFQIDLFHLAICIWDSSMFFSWLNTHFFSGWIIFHYLDRPRISLFTYWRISWFASKI